MLVRSSARTTVGVVLKFPYSFERKGDSTVTNSLIPLTVSSDTTVRTYHPLRIAAGLGFRPDKRSLLALSATWMDWRSYGQKTTYRNPIPGVFDDSDGNPARWKNVVLYAVGYERAMGRRWTLRCGLLYDEAPEPKRYRTLVGGLVVDTWKLSVGAGVDVGGNTLNLGYTYAFGPDVSGYVPDADYGVTTHEFYVGYEWKF
jgi:long-subunit fatty acid transport protein